MASRRSDFVDLCSFVMMHNGSVLDGPACDRATVTATTSSGRSPNNSSPNNLGMLVLPLFLKPLRINLTDVLDAACNEVHSHV